MRRTTITLSAALMLLAFAPATALARHQHRRHHGHARIERFGRDVTNASTTSNSADTVGTVQSFSGGVLTIMLADHSTVSGTVTNDTELECMAPEQSQAIHAEGDGGGGDQGSASDQGSGSDQSSASGSDDQAQGSGDQSSGDDQNDAAELNENQVEDQNQNQAEDQNENDAAEQNENEDAQNNCSMANLTRDTVVREAELRISSAGSVWKKLEFGS